MTYNVPNYKFIEYVPLLAIIIIQKATTYVFCISSSNIDKFNLNRRQPPGVYWDKISVSKLPASLDIDCSEIILKLTQIIC